MTNILSVSTVQATMNELEQQMIDGLKVNRPTPPNQGPIVPSDVPCKKHPGYTGFKEPADRTCKGCRWLRLQYLYFRDKITVLGLAEFEVEYKKSRKGNHESY